MKNEEAERAIGQIAASANAIKQIRYDIATNKANLSRLRERRDIAEAEIVVNGLQGKNETERKAALLLDCTTNSAWASANNAIRQAEEQIARMEAEAAYHELVARACRLTAEQITAETLPV